MFFTNCANLFELHELGVKIRFMKEVGSRKSEVGSRKSEVGSRKSEVGSRKSEVGKIRGANLQRIGT